MKNHLELQSLSLEQFRRLIGVKRKTFEKIVLILREEQNKRYRKAGRKGLLNLEDKLLMTLKYLREYRTYFHVGRSYGLNESVCLMFPNHILVI